MRHEEWHVTVEGDPVLWHLFCTQQGVTPLHIELNTFTRQLMMATTESPSEFLLAAQAAGFGIVRVKHEVSELLPGERYLYRELHAKFNGVRFRHDRKGSSRDLYRADRWYLTCRIPYVEPRAGDVKDAERVQRNAEAVEQLFRQRATGLGKGSQLVEIEAEYCLTDTNLTLDAGWL